ncbi:DNA-binding protein [Microbacterium esteraromaticum]|uniref:DNA-binding protein n=1 Tax=Microbacterium esteraromaticum TaxID=57043 RepID=A0A1R4J6B6_9MICO|nr:pyridoxamine 5'-phosphate oxidase family protein [Microbacterium esteraromaticum]SJN27587.1 DNA-binding protein [Microbacterium esteraromaticum]
MISALDEQESFALLSAASIGRVGLVRDGRVEIIPVNYLMDGHDVIVHTRDDGILSHLPEQSDVAFEVDHHDDLGGTAWSVLLSGRVIVVPENEQKQLSGVDRVRPWAGGERSLCLRLVVERISGRRVSRRRNP